jgi:F420-dependent oxidoreductase-like protein
VKVGLQISSFTWPGGDADIAQTLARICRAADDAGFDSIWVMDHLFQIRSVGEIEEPMLEGMTTLGYMAAHTQRARLGLMVGAVPYREPGLWIKATTTLDVLSGGRAWLGIGAAWNVEEARSLGIPFPDLPDRFRLLDDTLKMAHRAWRGERDSGPFNGRVVKAQRVMLSPQQLSKPHIPILVGGGGERTTLRLVARYADACNVFGAPDMLRHKYEVLRRHCDAVGRDYDSIEKTNLSTVSITPDGKQGSLTPAKLTDRLAAWAEAGSHQTIFSIRGVSDISKIELIGRDVIPQIKGLGQASPLDSA